MLSKLDKDACIASKELKKLSRCTQVNLFDLCVSFFSLQSYQRPLVVKRDRCSLFVEFDEKNVRGRMKSAMEKVTEGLKGRKTHSHAAGQETKRSVDPIGNGFSDLRIVEESKEGCADRKTRDDEEPSEKSAIDHDDL